MTWERIPANTAWGRKRVIHAHDKARAGQNRGIPALAAVMQQFKVLKRLPQRRAEGRGGERDGRRWSSRRSGQEQVVELLTSDADALKTYQDGLSAQALGDRLQARRHDPADPARRQSRGFTPARPSDRVRAVRHDRVPLHRPG
jgi:hypothetical protein